MKAVFAHDHRFYTDGFKYYSDGGFNDETWKRYKSVFNQVAVIARLIRLDKLVKLHEIRTPNVSIHDTKQFIINDKLMKKLIRESDFVIARLHSFIGNRAIKYARKYNKPYLIELVACPFEAYWSHGIIGKLIAPYMELMTKKLVKDAPYVIYVTEKYLQQRYPTKGQSIHCSNVALNDFENDVIESRITKIKAKCEEGRIIIGTTASVNVKYKGQQFVIEALGRLKKVGITNIEYQLVGGGDQGYLKSVAKKYNVTDQVKFLGSLAHEQVFNWLDMIDIYVQPSRQEGLPRALIEAMSRGLPAFGARTAGIPELLEAKFIFSNTRNNISEICEILRRFDKETMINQSKRNYIESKKYDKNLIETRRRKFFIDFANSIGGK